MPDPKKLKIGDRVKFVSLPDEWKAPKYFVHAESVAFMEAMIARTGSSRVNMIGEDGCPWIDARVKNKGVMEHHSWDIREESGWRLVRKRR